MIVGQTIGNFVVSNHFLERWYERSELPGTYFEIVAEENVFIEIGTDTSNQTHYMFSCPSLHAYYVFIVSDRNTLITLLTEKIYKGMSNTFDTQRAKKNLKLINKKMREQWSKVKIYVNSYLMKEYEINKTDDVVMSRIMGLNQAAKDCAEMMDDNSLLMRLICESDVPITRYFHYEIHLADIVVVKDTLTLKPTFMQRASELRSIMRMPKNRALKRMLKKQGFKE